MMVSGEKTPRPVERAVFAMPVLPDFGVTHQWLRELRRWHGERMVAVHVRVPDDLVVLVGRYGQAHRELEARHAAKHVAARPAGAEIVVPRAIGRAEIVAVRELTQLVGWVEIPEAERRFDCVCPVCLPRGIPDRVRRLNAAYRRALDAYRRATTTDAKLDALAKAGTVLGEARGRLDEAPLVRIARSPDPEVRQRAAALLATFGWSRASKALAALLFDDHPFVRSRAVDAILRCAGPLRAARLLVDASPHGSELLVELLGDEPPTHEVACALAILAERMPEELAVPVAKKARALLDDEADDPRARGVLRGLAAGLKSW